MQYLCTLINLTLIKIQENITLFLWICKSIVVQQWACSGFSVINSDIQMATNSCAGLWMYWINVHLLIGGYVTRWEKQSNTEFYIFQLQSGFPTKMWFYQSHMQFANDQMSWTEAKPHAWLYGEIQPGRPS